MGLPVAPSEFEALVAAPGQSICLRLINRFRFRKKIREVMSWWLNEDGTLSQEFLDMLCDIDCPDTSVEDLCTGLQLYWNLNEASGTRSPSIGSVSLTALNAPLSGTGVEDSCAAFVAASSQALTASMTSALVPGSEFTISCHVKFNSIGTMQGILGCDDPNDDLENYSLLVNEFGKIRFVLGRNGGGSVGVDADSFGPVVEDTWYHVAVYRSGTLLYISVNGTADSVPFPYNHTNSAALFSIGRFYHHTSDEYKYLDGFVDEVAFYNRALNSAELTALKDVWDMSCTTTTTTLPSICDSLVAYWKLDEASGTRVDATGRGNDLEPTNAPGTAAGVINDGVDFVAASSQKLSIAHTADTKLAGEFTVSAWVYLNSLPTGSDHMLIVGTDGSTGGAGGVGWVMAVGSLHMKFRISYTGGTEEFACLDFGTPPTGEWIHVAAYLRDGVGYIKVNNVNVYSSAFASTPNDDASVDLAMGLKTQSGWVALDGRVDEVGIWSRALTDEEITELYTPWEYNC